jgi:hypothetical protein
MRPLHLVSHIVLRISVHDADPIASKWGLNAGLANNAKMSDTSPTCSLSSITMERMKVRPSQFGVVDRIHHIEMPSLPPARI